MVDFRELALEGKATPPLDGCKTGEGAHEAEQQGHHAEEEKEAECDQQQQQSQAEAAPRLLERLSGRAWEFSSLAMKVGNHKSFMLIGNMQRP